jgi:uncharacterized protein YjbI with pentapeptide repeats
MAENFSYECKNENGEFKGTINVIEPSDGGVIPIDDKVFREANFVTICKQVSFRRCHFIKCNFPSNYSTVSFDNSKFEDCLFNDSVFQDSKVNGCCFTRTHHNNSKWTNGHIVGTNFADSVLNSMLLQGSTASPLTIRSSIFAFTDIEATFFRKVSFEDVVFTFCNANNSTMLEGIVVDRMTRMEGTQIRNCRVSQDVLCILNRNTFEWSLSSDRTRSVGVTDWLYKSCAFHFWQLTDFGTSFSSLVRPLIYLWFLFASALFLGTLFCEPQFTFNSLSLKLPSPPPDNFNAWNNWFSQVIDHFVKCAYYSLVTASTLGYGDIYPTSLLARLFTIALIGSGYVLFALVAARVAKVATDS